MNEDTDRAQLLGELKAQGKERGEQLAKLERSICRLTERMERKFDEQTERFEIKVAEHNKLSGDTHIKLISHLAQMRVVKWLVAIMLPAIVVLGLDRWFRGE